MWRYLEYLAQWHKHEFDCIVFAQSPYPRPIHPSFAAALAYDPMRQDAEPPSVRELADFLCEGDPALRRNLAWCLRDSWRLLYGGMLFVNHNLGGRGAPTSLHSQCVDQVEYIVSLVAGRFSTPDSVKELKVIALGADGTSAGRMLASALSKVCRVQVLRGKHPAYIARLSPEAKLVTPMLTPQHRSYMVQRILAAAASSVRGCVQVSESEYPVARGQVCVQVPSGSLNRDLPGAEGRLLSVAATLRSTFPLPVVCLGVGTDLGLEQGLGNNSMGRVLECYRDWLVATTSTLAPKIQDSCAVETRPMSFARHQQRTHTADVDGIARIMDGVDEAATALSEVSTGTDSLLSSSEPLSSVSGMQEFTTALRLFQARCQAASAALVMLRARAQAQGYYDSVSRSYGRPNIPLRSPGPLPSASGSVPLNSSTRTLSTTSADSSTGSSSPVVARATRRAQGKGTSALPTVTSEPPSATQPCSSGSALKVGPSTSAPQLQTPPQSAVASPGLGTVRARRPRPTPMAPSPIAPVDVNPALPPTTPAQGSSGLEYAPPLDEPESPSVVRVATMARPRAPQLSFSSLGIPAEVPHSVPAKVGVEPPSQHVLAAVGRAVRSHSGSSGASTVKTPSTAHPPTAVPEGQRVASVLHGDYKAYLAHVRFWADDEGLQDISDSLSEYIDGGVTTDTAKEIIQILQGLGETLSASLVECIFSSECTKRYLYIQDLVRGVSV